MGTLERGTGSTRSVYDALWARFLEGTYRSGDRLLEATLAEQLGVSRTPVREAIGQMLAEGLVTPAARGVVVSSLDHDARRRLFDFRCNLEGFSAELTAGRVREGLLAPAWFKELRESAETFASCVQSGDAPGTTDANMRFHELIVQASGNEFLADAHRRAIGRLAVSTALNLEHVDWAAEAAQQHEYIVEAIEQGDGARARSRAETHIHDAIRVFEGTT